MMRWKLRKFAAVVLAQRPEHEQRAPHLHEHVRAREGSPCDSKAAGSKPTARSPASISANSIRRTGVLVGSSQLVTHAV